MLQHKLVSMHMRPSTSCLRYRYILMKNSSDHIEGEAVLAEKNSHANDDGVIDKKEKKAMQKAHKRQLANRQRGIYSFRPYRTAIWMKEGIKRRIIPAKNSEQRDCTSLCFCHFYHVLSFLKPTYNQKRDLLVFAPCIYIS